MPRFNVMCRAVLDGGQASQLSPPVSLANRGGEVVAGSAAHRHHLIVEATDAETAGRLAREGVEAVGGTCNDVSVEGEAREGA